jgi:hypothetical protein
MSEEEWRKRRGKIAAAAAVSVMKSTSFIIDHNFIDDAKAMAKLAFLLITAKGLSGERR